MPASRTVRARGSHSSGMVREPGNSCREPRRGPGPGRKPTGGAVAPPYRRPLPGRAELPLCPFRLRTPAATVIPKGFRKWLEIIKSTFTRSGGAKGRVIHGRNGSPTSGKPQRAGTRRCTAALVSALPGVPAHEGGGGTRCSRAFGKQRQQSRQDESSRVAQSGHDPAPRLMLHVAAPLR
jgi:hypothetical protein